MANKKKSGGTGRPKPMTSKGALTKKGARERQFGCGGKIHK